MEQIESESPPVKPEHRLFFALQPSHGVRLTIGAVRSGVERIRSPVSNDRLHVTMGITRDYPEFPELLAKRMLEIGEAVSAAPPEVVLDRLTATGTCVALRPRRRMAGLQALFEALDRSLSRSGFRRPDWTFNPHVTLGYGEGEAMDDHIAPIAWTAREFVLIHSVVGRHEHHRLGAWPLESRQGELFWEPVRQRAL